MYIQKPLKKYIDDLASGKVAPGGGSASALAASLGIALSSMVANFTVGNVKYKKNQTRIKTLLKRNELIRKKISMLVDLDIVVYLKLNEVLKLPKDSKKRQLLIQQKLKQSAAVPLDICVLCGKAMQLCGEISLIGNINLISDLGCAAHLLESAYHSAKLNVYANFKFIKDKKFIASRKKKLKSISTSIARMKKQVIGKVEKSL
ncbi:MAG: cyclodeaminase/cyclohydrolase family protein [PVC group bacterium]|nr:cyclodeaminase/cyclohydrolase family protein [PVC group bacterium]